MSSVATNSSFGLTIDGHDLGTFLTIEGLGVNVEITEYREGGNPYFAHQLPGQLRYDNIVLSRPIDQNTAKVMEWLKTMADGMRRGQAELVAFDAKGDIVVKWPLLAVIPVRWTGPHLDVDNRMHATETLELAHHGFLFS
ncbi:MAG: phage tail protein [Acidimicrobiales bacterium]